MRNKRMIDVSPKKMGVSLKKKKLIDVFPKRVLVFSPKKKKNVSY